MIKSWVVLELGPLPANESHPRVKKKRQIVNKIIIIINLVGSWSMRATTNPLENMLFYGRQEWELSDKFELQQE